jgi:hypothetical protein
VIFRDEMQKKDCDKHTSLDCCDCLRKCGGNANNDPDLSSNSSSQMLASSIS